MKRKKQNRLLLILFILLIIFAIAYILLRQYNQQLEEEEALETQESTIAFLPENLDVSDIIGFSFIADKDVLQFEYSDDTWYLSTDHTCPLDQDIISSIVSNMNNLTARRQVDDSLEQLDTYGLDNPSNTITIVDADGVQATIYIGNANSVTDDYYIYMEDDTTVYTIESSFANAFNYDLTDLIQIEDFPEMSADLLTDVTVQKSDGTWTMDYKEEGDSSIDYTATSTWFLTTPNNIVSAMDSSLSSTMTSTVCGLTPESCIAYNITDSDLANYGLKDPAAKITVHYQEAVTVEAETETQGSSAASATSSSTAESDSTESQDTGESEDETKSTQSTQTVYEPRTLTFSIGIAEDKNGESTYYINWQDSKQIYSISEDTAKYFLDLSADSFTSMTPFNILPANVDQLKATVGDTTTTYKITRSSSVNEDEEETTKTTYTKNNEEISSEDFNVLYEKLQDLTAEKLYSKDNADEGVTGDAVTIELTLNNTEMKTVTFTMKPYDNNYYSVALNGTNTWLVNKMDVSTIIKKID